MLRGMTARQLEEWHLFAQLEPFDADREEDLFASIVQVIANANRPKVRKHRPYTLDESRTSFGDRAATARPQKTLAQMKDIAKNFVKDSLPRAKKGKKKE
jgi:hypothetical protein